MNKKNIIFLIIGLILFITPFVINSYSVIRLVSLLIGLILIELSLIINKKDKVWRIVLLPILFIILSFGLDYGITHLFNRIPIFAHQVKSSKKVITYNSLFYRVYSCDKNLIVDNLYKKEYQCSKKDLETVDVTSFLNNVIENYREHNDEFVKVEGKVSKVNGNYNLVLQGYTLTEDSINGYVLFGDNISLEVNFNEVQDLTKFKVYDSITVIGRIDELNKNGELYTIKMYDSIILESDLYETFEINVVEKDKCENDKTEYAKTPEITYYTSCLESLFVRYDAENAYDLSYVLIDKKMTLDKLIKNNEEKIEENGNTLYKFEKFNVLECANKNEVIIGNKKLKVDSPYCEVPEPNTDEEL